MYKSNTPIVCDDAKTYLQNFADPRIFKNNFICLKTLNGLINKSLDLANILALIRQEGIEELCLLECELIKHIVFMEKYGLFFNKKKWKFYLEKISLEQESIANKLSSFFKKDQGFLLFKEEGVDLKDEKFLKGELERISGHKINSLSIKDLQYIDHEAVKLFIKYKENQHTITHYGDNFLGSIKNDRIHANFIPLGAQTGRMACQKPNLQALPKSKIFQEMLIPDERKVISFDYVGFELRILAALSQDEGFLRIFSQGQDFHANVAEAIFNTEVSKTKNAHLREKAKTLNFGIIYGMGENALAKSLKISSYEASDLMDNYLKRFKKVKEFLHSLEEKTKRGYVNTRLGRRLYLEDIDNGHNLRVGRNMPIQGTGADIAKLALIKVSQALLDENLDAQIVNAIHDELVVESGVNDEDQVKVLVISKMEEAFSAILPEVRTEVSFE